MNCKGSLMHLLYLQDDPRSLKKKMYCLSKFFNICNFTDGVKVNAKDKLILEVSSTFSTAELKI